MGATGIVKPDENADVTTITFRVPEDFAVRVERLAGQNDRTVDGEIPEGAAHPPRPRGRAPGPGGEAGGHPDGDPAGDRGVAAEALPGARGRAEGPSGAAITFWVPVVSKHHSWRRRLELEPRAAHAAR
jgi:hypothetical protein